jgi:putative toxin-antitoxin system antitoxin component (TIGR02293 family)
MLAGRMNEQVYNAYRLRLEASLHIPADAADQSIHEIIAAGIEPASVNTWCEQSTFSADMLSQVIPTSTFHRRLARGQRLTLIESDRLFRLAHVAALAETVFGNKEKAWCWLCKPKKCFAGMPPIALLSTYPGTRLIEELLIEELSPQLLATPY